MSLHAFADDMENVCTLSYHRHIDVGHCMSVKPSQPQHGQVWAAVVWIDVYLSARLLPSCTTSLFWHHSRQRPSSSVWVTFSSEVRTWMARLYSSTLYPLPCPIMTLILWYKYLFYSTYNIVSIDTSRLSMRQVSNGYSIGSYTRTCIHTVTRWLRQRCLGICAENDDTDKLLYACSVWSPAPVYVWSWLVAASPLRTALVWLPKLLVSKLSVMMTISVAGPLVWNLLADILRAPDIGRVTCKLLLRRICFQRTEASSAIMVL